MAELILCELGEQGILVLLAHGQAGAVQHLEAVAVQPEHLVHVQDDAPVADNEVLLRPQQLLHLGEGGDGPALAVVADDARDVGRVVRDDVVPVHADAERLEPALELLGRGLAAVVRDDDAADVQPAALERVDQAQGVVVIGDAEIAAALEISEGTVKSRISRAKMRLRELLDGSGNLFDGGAVLQTEISERREQP